jgi:AbiV family abortive infection protein
MSKSPNAHSRPRYFLTTFRLARAAFENAVRLAEDSCTLFAAGAYPSAFSLAVLGLEEIGKFEMVDHFAGDAWLNAPAGKQLHPEMIDSLFRRDLFYRHQMKQEWAVSTTVEASKLTNGAISTGGLDRDKQDGFYIGYARGRVQRPTRISAARAYRQLKLLADAIVALDDVPFWPKQHASTRQSRVAAQRCTANFLNGFEAIREDRRSVRVRQNRRRVRR